MNDDEGLREDFGRWGRRIAWTVVIVAAVGGYFYHRRSQPSPAKTPREHLAILRNHNARTSARHQAAGALKANPSVIPELIDELEQGDDDGRLLAAMALGSMGIKATAATDAVTRAVHDASPFVRRQVAASLPRISEDPALVASSLDPLVRDTDVETRRLAFEALLDQGDHGCDALIRLLSDPDVDLRQRAAAALGRTDRSPEVAKALRRTLDDDDSDVRAAALKSLLHTEAVDFRELAGMIANPKLRAAAAGLLRERKDDAQPAVPLLRELLKSKASDTVITAAMSLKALDADMRPAVPLLRELLKSEENQTVIAAIGVLQALGPSAREASNDLVALVDGLERSMKLADDPGRWLSAWWADMDGTVLNALFTIGLESEFQSPELWQQLEAAGDEVVSLVLDHRDRSMPDANPRHLATDADLVHLERLRNLRLLTLRQTRIGNAGLIHIAKLAKLERLDLRKTTVSSAGLIHLANLSSLKSLSLNECAVDDEGLLNLHRLVRLRKLELSATQITDAGLKHLSDMTALQFLSLPKQVTDAGLTHLRGATDLEELYGGQFSPQAVLQFPNLIAVSLQLPFISDADLACLSGLPRLRCIGLEGTSITDAGLELLGHFEQLESLDLRNTAITDAGLAHLKTLSRLKNLDLNGKELTSAAVAQLQESIPNAHIFRVTGR